MPVDGGELWRTGRALDPAAGAVVAGIPHAWRHLLAGRSAGTVVVLLGRESGRPRITLGDDDETCGPGPSRWCARCRP